MHFISELEPDEAGLDLAEVSRRYGISPENIIMLSRNENPYGPSSKVWDAFWNVQLHLYPDQESFLEILSGYTGYPKENIVIGAGMDDVISTVSKLFLGTGDKALIPIPTYTFYSLAVRLCRANPIYQQRREDFEVDPEVQKDVKLIFICSPNNPTGNMASEETVKAIAESTEGIVFLDEAYAEFAEKNMLKLVNEFDNIIVGRTLSKAFGLAGLRLGYAVAPEWIAKQYRQVSPLFGVSSLSLAAGVAALDDVAYMRQTVAKIISEREKIRKCMEVSLPSQGNFLFLQTKESSSSFVERLLSKGVVVRDCASFPGSGDHCIRVTVGTPEQNSRFLEAFAWADQAV
jgi:histidinol-phosphate aminotransferase